jgi:uncharacterized protein YciI
MSRFRMVAAPALVALLVSAGPSLAQGAPAQATPAAAAAAKPAFDDALAKRVGADDRGMRNYVLVILRTGPTKVPAGPERDAMFKGHFANMERLSNEGKLALAGPFGTDAGAAADDWRGLFIFAVPTVAEAKALVATDPTIQKGELVAEYHKWYGSAAVMLIPDAHKTIAKQSF